MWTYFNVYSQRQYLNLFRQDDSGFFLKYLYCILYSKSKEENRIFNQQSDQLSTSFRHRCIDFFLFQKAARSCILNILTSLNKRNFFPSFLPVFTQCLDVKPISLSSYQLRISDDPCVSASPSSVLCLAANTFCGKKAARFLPLLFAARMSAGTVVFLARGKLMMNSRKKRPFGSVIRLPIACAPTPRRRISSAEIFACTSM